MNRWDDLLSRLPCEPASPELAERICQQWHQRLRPSLFPFLSLRQARRLAWMLDGLSLGLLMSLLVEGTGYSLMNLPFWWHSLLTKLAYGWNALWMADWHFLGQVWNGLQSWSVTVLPLALAFLALGLFLMVVSSLFEWLKSDLLLLPASQSRKNLSLHDPF